MIDNSASYINGWRKVISSNTRLIVRAASQAEKAARYVMGTLDAAGLEGR